jgi:hypothetical protein
MPGNPDLTAHFTWCKTRALEYVDNHDLVHAVASFGNDLLKNDAVPRSRELARYIARGSEILVKPQGDVTAQVRAWIDEAASLLGVTI